MLTIEIHNSILFSRLLTFEDANDSFEQFLTFLSPIAMPDIQRLWTSPMPKDTRTTTVIKKCSTGRKDCDFIHALGIFPCAASLCQTQGCSLEAKCVVHQGTAVCECPLGKSGTKCTHSE